MNGALAAALIRTFLRHGRRQRRRHGFRHGCRHGSRDGSRHRRRHGTALHGWIGSRLSGRPGRCPASRFGSPAAALLAVLALLQGCAPSGLRPRQILHVVVVPTETLNRPGNDLPERQLWQPLLHAFRRLHPEVSIDLTVVSQSSLGEVLRQDSLRGLAPDLLLLRSTVAVSMVQRGLLDPLPSQDPTIDRVLGLIAPRMLAQVNTSRGFAGLPAAIEPSLACYDRRRVASAPTSVDALLNLAASGRSVGLAIDPVGLWWSAGALGAQGAMLRSIGSEQTLGPQADPADRQSLLRWLTWLRQAALQSRVQLASGPQELVTGLEKGIWPGFPVSASPLNVSRGSWAPASGSVPCPAVRGGHRPPSSPHAPGRSVATPRRSSARWRCSSPPSASIPSSSGI